MVKKTLIYIFIYTLLVGCNNEVLNPGDNNYFLEISAPHLNLDGNGYYHIEWLPGYLQTFSTLDAETGSNTVYQKVYWNSDSGIYESVTGDWVSCVNPASYTNNGLAHTVLSVREEMITDTITVYAWYRSDYDVEYLDSIKVVVEDEI